MKNMDEILKIDTIEQYNNLFGFQTLHPLVSLVDFDAPERQENYRMTIGFYGIFLKETKGCVINYGKSNYDYDDETVVSFAPGQTVGFTRIEGVPPKSIGLLFHPDFIRGTSLGQKIKKYTFFSYEANEALHMSDREREIVINCFLGIREELEHAIDKHSRAIITANIEVFLNHCVRFYDRQFVTRKDVNKDILSRFEDLLVNYFDSEAPLTYGLPSVAYCADKLHLSANYFGDLIKKEAGKSAQEYIQLTVINRVKERFADQDKSVSEIAYELGFKYPHHLSRLFKKVVGCSPNEYRAALS